MMNVIDLFSGCGGLSKGFELAGFKVIAGIDMDTAALETFALNHPGAKAVNADLSQAGALTELEKIADGRPVDVIIAGPPCQGFSQTGPRNFDDPRNKLYLAVIDAVRLFKPKAFIVENVPGMAAMHKGEVKEEVLKRFRALGYNTEARILCAADYAVPQKRKRLVFMGIRQDIGIPVFPEPWLMPEQYITCREAIDDLPALISDYGAEISSYTKAPRTSYQKLMRGNCEHLYNHVACRHSAYVRSVIAQVPEGGNWRDLPAEVGNSRHFHEAWTRYDGNKPSRTIDTGHRNHFHYEYNRVPTVRENARLQSFPDDFIFKGTKTQQHRQVGNAVPPLLGKALAQSIARIIEVSELKCPN